MGSYGGELIGGLMEEEEASSPSEEMVVEETGHPR